MNTFETAKALFMQGLEKLALEDWATAEECFRESLRLLPGRISTLNNLAGALIKLKKLDEAELIISEVLEIDPATPEAWTNKGLICNANGNFSAAIDSFNKAIDLSPNNPEAWSNRGVALAGIGDYEGALNSYQQAIQLNPGYFEAWSNRGVALNELGQNQEALLSYQHTLELKPDYLEAWCNRGTVLNELDRHHEALACYDHAIALKPDYAQAYNNKGLTLANLGQDDGAFACYGKAIALCPEFADPHWNQGLLHIKHEDYPAGWAEFEYRWQVKSLNLRKLESQKPVWSGQPSSLPLLLWGEQGIGDQVLYGSILSDLARLPQKKYVALDKRLIPLFQRSMPEFEFLDLEQISDALDFAEHLPLGSLPQLFRSTKESFNQAHHPYLRADQARAHTLRQQIKQSGKRICGVSWSSNRKNIGKHKSIHLEQMLVPLAANRLHFVNLQYGDTTAECSVLQTKYGITIQNVNEVDNFNDIDGLAALIDACDIVLTTSNSTAHLAGALGKETLLLLPFGRGKLWYWAQHEGKCPWYPAVRSFTQEQPGQWQEPLTHIKSYLS